MQADELILQLPHHRLSALAWGDPSLPPLLALHGWLDNAASFQPIAPLLARDFRVVAVDWPGHGRSDHRPPGAWYHYIDYLGDLQGAADALGWDRFSLLGHSLGGTIASVYAAARPERVERLMSIEALGPLTGAPDQSLEQLRRGVGQRDGYSEKALRVFDAVDIAVVARRMAGDLQEASARLLVERGIEAVPGGWSWSSDPRLTLATPVRYTEAQIRNILAGIAAPSLLLLAEPATSYLPTAQMDERAACVPGIVVQRLPGNHHLHMHSPDVVARVLLDFCRTDADAPRAA